ncbi:hypothetical protein [Algicola sagamiensis]|uniref:hypothetical protein n=1 Tax=Algicola sagamiensis TaxID=163869 RepID=UPI000362D0A7|nr:hypothetical protein [Algicola sagamiensis]
MKLHAEQLIDALQRQHYQVFEGEMNLNLVGVRTANTRANTFNDYFCVLYQQGEQWQLEVFPCTTDPGTYYRQHPLNVDGTAVMVPMQHRSLWTFGYHQGKYQALVQNKPVSVYRDGNQDDAIDTDVAIQRGFFGINCHRAHADKTVNTVDRWSAGCQVLANPKDFQRLMGLCLTSAAQWGNVFSYTLLTQAQLKE